MLHRERRISATLQHDDVSCDGRTVERLAASAKMFCHACMVDSDALLDTK
jgi:hypothetical protein